MDLRANILTFDCTGMPEEITFFISLVAMTRLLQITFVNLGAGHSPSILHRGLQIDGLWPITEYLLDMFPYPTLLPDTPQRRSIVRSITERLLTKTASFDELESYYGQKVKSWVEFPDGMSIMDLAVASFENNLKATVEFPWIKDVSNLVRRTIKELSKKPNAWQEDDNAA